MDNNLVYSEFFDKYLKGKLSENEKIAFEKKVRQDPLLHSELKLQKEIYAALGEARKAALKSRLDQVPVNNVGWFNMPGAKLAAVIGSVLVVATSSFFYITKEITDESEHPIIEIDPSYVHSNLYKDNITVSVPHPKTDQIKTLPETFVDKAEETKEVSVTTDVSQKASATPKKDLLPTIIRPDLDTFFDEETQQINYDDFEAPKKHIVESTAFDNDHIDIEAAFHERYNFHYQFKDNKLYLYGNFGNTLYKIIALNSDKGKKLFLEFNTHFYAIDHKQVEIAPLQMIEDPLLIRELKRISVKDK